MGPGRLGLGGGEHGDPSSSVMSLLGQNIISINVENSSRVMRAAVPPVPTLPFIRLLSVIPGNADLRVRGSQATPGAGRNRPQDANSASKSSRCSCGCQKEVFRAAGLLPVRCTQRGWLVQELPLREPHFPGMGAPKHPRIAGRGLTSQSPDSWQDHPWEAYDRLCQTQGTISCLGLFLYNIASAGVT